MKITIVTVVCNDVDNIENTIKSVIFQNYDDIEYIIIDGGSTDGTCDVVENFYRAGKVHIYESSQDNGIYDAMNKGIVKASGDYICFMNSGDIFFDSTILKEVCSRVFLNGFPDFAYGDTAVIKGDYQSIIKARQFDQIKNGLPFCHQSVFIKLCLHSENLYDTQFRYASDYNFFAAISLKQPSWAYLENFTISTVTEGGAADIGRLRTATEYLRIAARHFYIPRWGQIWLFAKVLASLVLPRFR